MTFNVFLGLFTFLQRVLSSIYSSLSIFDKLEQDILKFCTDESTYTCLMGDFNARSGLFSDFITIDEDIGDLESKLILSKNNLKNLDI